MKCWKRARSSASCPAAWARATRCAWKPPWLSTATRSRTRSTSSKPASIATAKLDKGDFLGRDALEAVRAAGGPKRKLVGLEMIERGIARDGYTVLAPDGQEDRHVTTGSPAPFLKKNIALALCSDGVHRAGNGNRRRNSQPARQSGGGADAVLQAARKSRHKPPTMISQKASDIQRGS